MSEIKLNFREQNGNYISVKSASQGSIGYIIRDPFDNCQITSFSCFCNVIGNYSGKELRDVLKLIHSTAGKSSMIVDVNTGYCAKIEKEFNGPEEIKFKTPYTNNTGSSMCMYLLHMQNYIIRINKEEKDALVPK